MKIRELPETERPREKLLSTGKDYLSTSELLALLIGSGTRGKTAMKLAEELLAMDPDGLRHLARCPVEELARPKGMGMAKACQVKAALELGSRLASLPPVERTTIASVHDAASLLQEPMRYDLQEGFGVLLLDTRGGVLGREQIAKGSGNSLLVHPREAFATALRRGATGVIFFHNHPSGDPMPSRDDEMVTERLCSAGDLLGIRVLDHIIIGDGRYYSFRDQGKMKNEI